MVLSCFKALSILSMDILLMISPHAMFRFDGRSYESDQETGLSNGSTTPLFLSYQGIPSRCSHERQSKDAAEGQPSRITVLFESQVHDCMAAERILTIGPQKPIPPRKIEPKIRVCFLRQH